MGHADAASVDIGAVLAAAGRWQHVADLVEDVARTHLTQLRFGGACAGRDHADDGEAVRRAVEGFGDDMRTWARACSEIASGLRASAADYVTTEARGAARLG